MTFLPLFFSVAMYFLCFCNDSFFKQIMYSFACFFENIPHYRRIVITHCFFCFRKIMVLLNFRIVFDDRFVLFYYISFYIYIFSGLLSHFNDVTWLHGGHFPPKKLKPDKLHQSITWHHVTVFFFLFHCSHFYRLGFTFYTYKDYIRFPRIRGGSDRGRLDFRFGSVFVIK